MSEIAFTDGMDQVCVDSILSVGFPSIGFAQFVVRDS